VFVKIAWESLQMRGGCRVLYEGKEWDGIEEMGWDGGLLVMYI
jgi:hypothetical protein